MKLLAIDTSGRALSGAVAENGRIRCSFAADTGKNHSLELLPLLRQMLEENDLRLDDMDAFAVTLGPGSFTGLRIGLATVKAWCQALNKPLIGISSLDAMAATVGREGYVAPLFDARRDQVYTALYRDGVRLTPDRAVSPDELAAELAELNASVCFGGDGLTANSEPFQNGLGERFRLPEHGNTLFMAAAAALLAEEKYKAGEFADIIGLTPVYLRLSEAEEKRLEKLKNDGR